MRYALYSLAPVGFATLLLNLPPATLPVPAGAAPASSCSYSPEGPVSLEIGEVQTFIQDEGSSCSDINVTITGGSGVAGFSSGSECTLTYKEVTLLFKIRGCAIGNATATVRSGSTVIQTFSIAVGPL